jgi:hypothetical protein
LAHFYFLSADLERAGRFLDDHPSVCFDLAPGSEMYNSFSRNDASREFFIRYQDRLVYGTDTTTGAIARDGDRGVAVALGRAWAIRTFLETDRVFVPPPGLMRWLEPDLRAFRGIALPREVLRKIYRTNFERLYSSSPAPLDQDAALALVQRMAATLDEQAGGFAGHNHARQVLEALDRAELVRCA